VTGVQTCALPISAGADPGRIVYVAITGNFNAADVIKGAASAVERMGLSDAAVLTQLTSIVSAANQAGATPSQVNSGLSNAGVPPAVIASASSNAATSPGPVYGYSAPAGPATGGGGILGATTVVIGGWSIGSRETKLASPTRP
jgi:hypothetical protein